MSVDLLNINGVEANLGTEMLFIEVWERGFEIRAFVVKDFVDIWELKRQGYKVYKGGKLKWTTRK